MTNDKQPVLSEDFTRVFEKAFSVTLTNIENDEFLLMNTELAVKETVSCLRRSREFSKIFHDIMFDVFDKSPSTLTSVSDGEEMLRKLHSYRVDAKTETQIMECLQDLHISATAYGTVVQIIHVDIVGEFFVQRTSYSNRDMVDANLTDSDRSIMYYISGYVLRKLKTRYGKLQDSDNRLSCLVGGVQPREKCSAFMDKVSEWARKQDRGGLTYPSEDFFLLFQQFELCVRKDVDSKRLDSTSLLCDRLIETIMESFIVKEFSAKAIQQGSQSVIPFVLEDCISLFLTVRGYAVASSERKKLTGCQIIKEPPWSIAVNNKHSVQAVNKQLMDQIATTCT